MTEETWKDIPEYPDYRISNLGRVKSLKFGKERILKQSKGGSGYLQGCLWNEAGIKTLRIHKLLGVAFLGFSENVEIDHIDGNPSNNRLENLRPCSHAENGRNHGKHRNNTTGYPGVTFRKDRGKYQARIHINGKNKYLGLFKSPEEAFTAYREANLKHFGEFSPFVSREEFKALSERVMALEGLAT